uniref:HECT-type E3 ubiquitin transferase n=1 Tax=Mya arenaria TaxID=6604 RepID=Q9XZN5_MYAAR|nr:E3 ubiquitin-protein ligase [Mya arenaria]
MKRAAAKQLIEAYYFQLTDGCGDQHCTNTNCASSTNFALKDKDRNVLAVMSIDLFKNKAQLCENERNKIARNEIPSPMKQDSPSQNSGPSKVTVGQALQLTRTPPIPGPSTSKSSGGATPKMKPSTPTEPKETPYLDEEKLHAILKPCTDTNDWSPLIKCIGSVFYSPESLIKSFQKKSTNNLIKAILQHDSDDNMDTNDDFIDIHKVKTVNLEDRDEINVDIESLQRCFEMLMDTPDLPFQNALINAIVSLSKDIVINFKFTRNLERKENYLNIFVIIMEIPLLHSPEFIDSAYPEFCKALGCMPLSGQVKLARYWSKFSADRLRNMVLSLQQLLTVKLIDGESKYSRAFQVNDDECITGPVRVMKILYYASLYGGQRDSRKILDEERKILEAESEMQNEMLGGAGAMGVEREGKEVRPVRDDPLAKELDISHADCPSPLVPFEDFINDTLNETVSMEMDYKYKLDSEETPMKFSFFNHSFVLNMPSKQMGLYMDNRVQMYKERRSSVIQTIVHGMPTMPYLRIRVSRNRIIDDALVALEMVAMENPSDLRKQLFVEFDGEQGVDEGGVSKEFFQLIVEEIFNVDFGMFTYNPDTRQFWFNPMSFENEGQFTLCGIVLGLAIYNSTIVDVHFPSVVYRKLVGKLGTFQDLKGVDPTLARTLQDLLDYEGTDMEDVFMQTFQISYLDVFGSTITHSLKDAGETIPVNQLNKQEFVDMYADFILNKSIEKQFRAFRRGFSMVTNESPLRALFRPEEIEMLICGSEDYDFNALEDACEYDGGFDKKSQTIRDFWEVVHGFDDEKKCQLLQFTTGTDRVPVGGLSKLKLIIARNGPDSDRLPTAHTCFNVLLLPDYLNKEKLQERLLEAITYSKGFGML